MSTVAHTPHDDPSNEDGINISKIIAVGVVSLVIFAISAVIAWAILRADEKKLRERGIAPVPAEVGKPEINLIDMIHFDADNRLEVWKAAKAKRLGSYGWVDRDKGLIHMPIDKAMDELIKQTSAGGGAK